MRDSMIDLIYDKLNLNGYIGYCGRPPDSIFLDIFSKCNANILNIVHLFDSIYCSNSKYDRMSAVYSFTSFSSSIEVLAQKQFPHGFHSRKIVNLNTIDQQSVEKNYSILIINAENAFEELGGFEKLIERDEPVLLFNNKNLTAEILSKIEKRYHPISKFKIFGHDFFVCIPLKIRSFIHKTLESFEYEVAKENSDYDVTKYIRLLNFFDKEKIKENNYWWSGKARVCLINLPLLNEEKLKKIEIYYEDKYNVRPIIIGVFNKKGNHIDCEISRDQMKIEITKFINNNEKNYELDILIKVDKLIKLEDSIRELGFLLYKVILKS
jgi:hypothetical protein